MNVFTGWLRGLGQRLKGLFSREAHRRITLLGQEAGAAIGFTHVLFNTEVGELNPLQVDDDTAHDIRELGYSEGASASTRTEVVTVPALYVPAYGRSGRRLRWIFHVPPSIRGQGDEHDLWKLRSNVFVVCWPYRSLGLDDQAVRDMRFRLTGAVGHARKQGRLRRVAVVVTGIPETSAPRHPSQVLLELGPREGLRAGLAARLAAAQGRPGDPLADPVWRGVLEGTVARDPEFVKFVEGLRRSVGTDCPIFFASGRKESTEGVDQVLEWIDRGGSRRQARGSAVANRACAAAAAILLVSLVGLAMIPPGLGDHGVSPAVADVTTLQHQLDGRLAAYGGELGLADRLLGNRSARPSLERVRVVVDDYASMSRMASKLNARTNTLLVGVDSMPPSQRLARADSLEHAISRHLASRHKYLELHAGAGPPSIGIAIWDDAMARALMAGTLLRMTAVNAGFGGWTIDPLQWAWTRNRMEVLRRPDLVQGLEQVLASRTAIEFYRAYLERECVPDRSTRGAFALAAPAAPRILLQRAFAKPGEERGLNAWLQRARLSQARVLMGSEFGRFVNRAPVSPEAVEEAITQASTRHPMVIRFRVMGETNWHLDISPRSPDAGFEPTHWAAMPSPETGCEYLVVNGMRGVSLWVRPNAQTPVHVTVGDAPCTRSAARRLDLNAPSGILRFASDNLTVQWIVTEGWDAPDLASSGVGP